MIGKPIRVPGADVSAEDDVRWWFGELERGRKRREKEEDRWTHNEKFENLRQWDEEFGVGDEVTVNKVGSYIRTFRAATAFRNPTAKMLPATAAGWEPVPVPEMSPDGTPKMNQRTGQVVIRPVLRHKLRENLVNGIIGKPLFGLTATISRIIKAGLLGYGAAKVGYRPTFETAPTRDTDDDMIPLLDDGTLDTSAFVESPVDGLPMEDDDGNLIKRAQVPVWEDWFVDWVSYRSIIIDPDGENDFMQHRWVAQEMVRSLEEIKADPLMKNTENLRPTGKTDEYTGTETVEDIMENGEIAERAKLVRLFEIYDLVKDRLIVLADGHGKALRNEQMPDGITHSPFVFYRTDEILGEFYQRPRVSDLAPINDVSNKLRRQEYVAAKKSNRKIIARKDAIDPEAMQKLTNNVDMAVVELDLDGPYGLGEALAPFTPPATTEIIVSNAIRQNDRDFDEVGGQPGESRGAATSKTATQVEEMGAYSGVRIDFDRSVLGECLVEIIEKLNDSIEVNMTVERAVQIEGDDGQAFVGVVDRDMIKGGFDVEIDVEDMAPRNDAMSNANMVQTLQVAGQAPWLFADEVLCRTWCENWNIKNERFIKALAAKAQQQMQMQMMEAQAKQQAAQPEAGPPTSTADAISQSGAGTQVPKMSGAS